MTIDKLINDDTCDIFSKKICDNCGKCLEQEGIDIRAINIEDISKDVAENKFIEDELKKILELHNNSEPLSFNQPVDKKYLEYIESLEDNSINEDYIDAFDNIVYLDEIGIEEGSVEELTDELYPGIRRLKLNH